ncbi:MAG: pilus assembly protein [Selenomonadaceae bacterium]|nr:pilus assembly protein [Selenomonadaceae bacterium]
MFKDIKQCFIRRGQVAVFYALMVPMIFLLGGVGLDLGWYYLKVSRMQNAADAAVMAGAWKFLEDEGTLSDYSDAKLIDFVPSYVLNPNNTGEPVLSPRSKATGEAKAKEYVKNNIAFFRRHLDRQYNR